MLEPNLDPSLTQQAINNFQEALTVVRSQVVYPLPDLTGQIEHNGQPNRINMGLVSGLFLDPAALDVEKAMTAANPDGVAFMTQPGNRLGRENSHHHVFFGKLLLTWFEEMAHEAAPQVAVKPIELKDRSQLLGELAMLQYMKRLGIPTFVPSGVLITTKGTHDHLLTQFDGPVQTMDIVEWEEMELEEGWAQLGYAIDTAVLLHSNLLFHGDLEFKNVAFGDRGERAITDPEYTISALALAESGLTTKNDEERARCVKRLTQLMSIDFRSICESIDVFIFGLMPKSQRPKNEAAKFKQYERHLYKPYRAALAEVDSQYTPLLLEVFDNMAHERKVDARNASHGA
ncbi:MAG TPA: hypothetical protein VHB51_00675 [Candidatus Saccharimonadales bacterium]|nr:hypothetical protein [Candidatus Saccharimonadales bacterium]